MGLIEYLRDAIYWNLIYESRYELILTGLKTTLILTLATFLAGTLLGMALCAAKGSRNRLLRLPAQLLTGVIVKLPPLVLLMLFAYLIFAESAMDPILICIIALALKSSSHLAEMFRSAVDSVDKGEIEAARTLGYSKSQAFRQVVFPQAMHQVMPLYKTQFVLTMQETSVVSLLAIQDMSRSVSIITSRTMDPFIALVISSVVYLTLGFVAGRILGAADRSRHITSTEMEG